MLNPDTSVIYKYEPYKVYAANASYVLIENKYGQIIQVRAVDLTIAR